MVDLLFVYGTLLRDSKHPMASYLARFSSLMGDAWIVGQLVRIDWYPGLVPAEEDSDQVHGQLIRLSTPAQALERLDTYEGIGNGEAPYEYVRVLRPIHFMNQQMQAWVYEYNWPYEKLEKIPGGRYQ